MLLVTIEGIYKNGQIELSETPVGIADGTEVIVTFLPKPPQTRQVGKMIEYGKYAGPIDTTDEDFRLVEFHGGSRSNQEGMSNDNN